MSTEPTTPARRPRRGATVALEAPDQLALALDTPAQLVETGGAVETSTITAVMVEPAAQELSAKTRPARSRRAKKAVVAPAAEPAEPIESGAETPVAAKMPTKTRARRGELPPPPAVGIRKALERIETITGWRFREVFSDWTEVALYTVEQQIRHDYARAIWDTIAQDPPGITEFFRRLQSKYTGHGGDRWPDVAACFAEALAHLQRAFLDDGDFQDVLGPLFMEYGSPDDRLGQFYTPASVAQMLNELIGRTGEKERAAIDPGYAALIGKTRGLQQLVREAMLEAIRADVSCATDFEAAVARGLAGDELDQVVLVEILPRCFQQHYEPPRLYEPCVGAGVMVLEALRGMPHWMRFGTLFTITAIDLSPMAYRMAKLQLLLTGIGGYDMCRAMAQRGDPACLRWRGLDVRCGNSLANPPPVWETPEGYGPEAIIMPAMGTPELSATVARITERLSPGAIGPGGRRLIEAHDDAADLARIIDLADYRATQSDPPAADEAA